MNPYVASNRSQINTFEQAQTIAEDQGLSLGSILEEVNEYANMRPPPNIPIRMVQNFIDGDSVVESELGDESLRRKIWAGRNVEECFCPL